jgi:hypothetical protein
VITLDGRLGIVGDTSTFGGDMNGGFLLVRSGALVGDRIALHFDQVGSTAPATWVEYGVVAKDAVGRRGLQCRLEADLIL